MPFGSLRTASTRLLWASENRDLYQASVIFLWLFWANLRQVKSAQLARESTGGVL